MTTRYCAFTVTLDPELRDDDAQPVMEAIRMVKGVHEVVPVVAQPEYYSARSSAKREILTKLFQVCKEWL